MNTCPFCPDVTAPRYLTAAGWWCLFCGRTTTQGIEWWRRWYRRLRER